MKDIAAVFIAQIVSLFPETTGMGDSGCDAG